MIIDDLARLYPGIAAIASQVPIVQVPFSVFPYDDSDGDPGLLWTEERLTGLVPLREIDGVPAIIGTLAAPPYPLTLLIGPQPEWGCLLVLAQPMDERKRVGLNRLIEAIMEQLRAHNVRIAPLETQFQWQMTAVTLGVCGQLGAFLITKMVQFYVGELVLPAVPTLYRIDKERLAAADDATLRSIAGYTLKNDLRARAIATGQVAPDSATIARLVDRAPREDLLRAIDSSIIDGDAMIRTVVTAFSLMHARNVVVDPVTPAFSRAARRRGEKPPLRYHVLKVRPLTRRRAGVAGSLHPEPTAIHWVRGHLKTYTDEKPLFGRFTGTYYWQAHVAGRDRTHQIEKDYEISRP